ncbi:DUF2461 domain-containing protein [Noviherbaspirillum galbum]|uniref:DUF2461 domain-containing protein n=1 Tax=Noviherbaspirillum galbum TaxID=2709383 RepID=A0A6B3SKG9_9BURK|nr:DUF2461 domain-containing protein [Noviherbaspirillum galbum]NEX61283.1 DUF2461 domain-containing protein [Noviherbaspirillum galbum]
MHLRDLIQFLGELAENNNRAWFVMNKPRYDILREEFLVLVTRLIADIGKFDPDVADCNPKKALFRINRDIRFANDKRPYKTYFSAAITASGLKKPSQGGGPAYYFHINEQGQLLVAGGEYMPPADRLRSIREQIAGDPAGFMKVLKNKKLKETFGDLQDEGKLVRPPKGFDPDSPVIDYLKHKSYIVWKETSLKSALPANLGKDLAAEFRHALPLVTWLRQVRTISTEE